MNTPQFSIIVPVYGTEKYITKCLDSIRNQSFDDFEVIIVNDGSPDNSQQIIDNFVKKDSRFKSFHKKNGGLSDARNFGVTKASGEYIVFVDSDDYISQDLLARIHEVQDGVDVVRFFHQDVSEEGRVLGASDVCKGEISLPDRFQFELVEAAWLYAYCRTFWIENNFQYAVGRLHEDFGLTPLVLAKADTVVAIDYIGYNYVHRQESITTDDSKYQKRIDDVIWFVDAIESTGNILDRQQFHYYANFMANGFISLAKRAKSSSDVVRLAKELRKRKLHKYLATDNLKRRIKYIGVRFLPRLYMTLLASK